jgi:hypothetical protein
MTPVNPDVNHIADQAKHCYEQVTQRLAITQFRLAELAGTGRLDPVESMQLQRNLFHIWQTLYFGTVCAVRHWNTDDWSEDGADNTYSDGREVKTRARFAPAETAEACWEHSPFLLGLGAVNDYPRGAIFRIAPLRPDGQAPGRLMEL